MKGPTVVDFPEGNVETSASEDANGKTPKRGDGDTFAASLSGLSDDGTARAVKTADAPTTLRDLRHFEKTQMTLPRCFSLFGTANLVQSAGLVMFHTLCVSSFRSISQRVSIDDCAVGGHNCILHRKLC